MFSKTHLLYERVSKSYYFQLVHDAEQPRRIQLHGSSLSVFPMGLHELAYGFPNSVLHTSGGGWNSVIEKPRLTGNRTVSTFLNDVKIPPHEFYVHPNGKVRITFTSVSPSDDLDDAGESVCHRVCTASEQAGDAALQITQPNGTRDQCDHCGQANRNFQRSA